MSDGAAPSGDLATALAHAAWLLARDARLAASQAEEILKVVDSHPQALSILGQAQAALGEDEAALRSLRRAVALNPGLPDAWRAIGDICGARGDAIGADQAYAPDQSRDA